MKTTRKMNDKILKVAFTLGITMDEAYSLLACANYDPNQAITLYRRLEKQS